MGGGSCVLLTQHPDPELEKRQMKQLKLSAQHREDGYLDTYYLINDQDMILQTLRTTMSCTASVI